MKRRKKVREGEERAIICFFAHLDDEEEEELLELLDDECELYQIMVSAPRPS